MSIFTPNKKIKMSETSEISPEQAAMDIKALNLFSRQNAALGEDECEVCIQLIVTVRFSVKALKLQRN